MLNLKKHSHQLNSKLRHTAKSISSDGIKLRNFSLLILAAGVLVSFFADVEVHASEPWLHLQLMLQGLFTPSVSNPQSLLLDLLYTVAVALIGVSVSVVAGFLLSLCYEHYLVRLCCAFFRAIHELFWALIFLQIFGLSVTTAILAIAIPYACTFARVFHDIYQQSQVKITQLSQIKRSKISYFLYVQLPQTLPKMQSYLRYRFECGIRTSAVLGFVGLPTIGFHLETAFKQADYSFAGALLIAFYLLIASIKYWLKLYLLPLYLSIAIYVLPSSDFVNDSENIYRFFSSDIWPRVVLGEGLSVLSIIHHYSQWFAALFMSQGVAGIFNTLMLSMMAVATTAVSCVLMISLIASIHQYWLMQKIANSLLLILRSTPEYILAFVLLLIIGPSMLPAVVALSMHNSALISFLLQRNLEEKYLRKATGFSDYLYKILPQIYPYFISLLMYRAEIILRESAILGVLGVMTLGFYIDSAFEDLRFDRAFALLFITAVLNILVDQFSRKMQLNFTQQGIRVRSRD